jgi:hypothetical protein
VAFNLGEFLQENRRFLAGTVVAAALFVVGTAIVGAVFGSELEAARFDVTQGKGKASKDPLFTAKNLETARKQEEALKASVDALAARLRFVPRPEFQLKDGGASPANQYLDIAARMREARLEEARARGVDLVESAGVPDRSPTQLEEIRRTLRGLDLVDRVLEILIRSRVRAVERIQIASERGREKRASPLFREEVRVEVDFLATSPALSAFLEATQERTPPLTIDSFDAVGGGASGKAAVSGGEPLVRVSVVFAALEPLAPESE